MAAKIASFSRPSGEAIQYNTIQGRAQSNHWLCPLPPSPLPPHPPSPLPPLQHVSITFVLCFARHISINKCHCHGYFFLSVAMAKETVNAAYELNLEEGLRFERRTFHALFATEDQKEGMAAFVEKRTPQWKHKWAERPSCHGREDVTSWQQELSFPFLYLQRSQVLCIVPSYRVCSIRTASWSHAVNWSSGVAWITETEGAFSVITQRHLHSTIACKCNSRSKVRVPFSGSLWLPIDKSHPIFLHYFIFYLVLKCTYTTYDLF